MSHRDRPAALKAWLCLDGYDSHPYYESVESLAGAYMEFLYNEEVPEMVRYAVRRQFFFHWFAILPLRERYV